MNTSAFQPAGPSVSERKLIANRANALHSTGPQTPKGKRRSSQNAVKFGFYGRSVVVLPSEDARAYERLGKYLWSGLGPSSALEALCVQEIVDTYWRLQRLGAVEATVFTRRAVSFTGQDCGPGFAFVNDAQGLNCFAKLAQYEAVLSRRLYRALDQLNKLQQLGSGRGGWSQTGNAQVQALGGASAQYTELTCLVTAAHNPPNPPESAGLPSSFGMQYHAAQPSSNTETMPAKPPDPLGV